MIQSLINRFKQRRTRGYLTELNRGQYAFVGIGQHSLTNLYPVLRYLGVSLKYICCTSEEKARLIGQKFPDVKATASLDEILHDEAVRGVFVSASPQAHFTLASKILQAGKALYIEKPPCQTSEELEELLLNHQLDALEIGHTDSCFLGGKRHLRYMRLATRILFLVEFNQIGRAHV